MIMTVKDYDAKISFCMRKMSECMEDYNRFRDEADVLMKERVKLLDNMELIPRLTYTSERNRKALEEEFAV